jgi:predicted TIM-barrel fold metal-dependent hydrolase
MERLLATGIGSSEEGRGSAEIIDARVRVPSPLRAQSRDAELYADYDAILGVEDAWSRTAADLRQELTDAGVDHAILHAEFEQGDLADELNEEVAALVTADPAHYSGFGTVTLAPIRASRAVAQVERIAELGLVGVNVQPAFFGHSIDDQALYPIYEKATELGLIIGIHTGTHYSRRHPIEPERPVKLDQVACDIPEATFIACHGGWPWIPEMVAVARRHPNVLIDFGGMSPKYIGVPGSGWEMMLRFMDRLLSKQILFATDWPVYSPARALEEWATLGLREETVTALLGGNARRLLARESEVVG